MQSQYWGYLVRNIVMFTHFITLAAPTLRVHNKSSVKTYMINSYRYWPTWNFTVVIGFSAVLPRPSSMQGKCIKSPNCRSTNINSVFLKENLLSPVLYVNGEVYFLHIKPYNEDIYNHVWHLTKWCSHESCSSLLTSPQAESNWRWGSIKGHH